MPIRHDPPHEGERRRHIDPTTSEPDYSPDEVEFIQALERYKRQNERPFPTWREVLQVLLALGYRKVVERQPLPGYEARKAGCREHIPQVAAVKTRLCRVCDGVLDSDGWAYLCTVCARQRRRQRRQKKQYAKVVNIAKRRAAREN